MAPAWETLPLATIGARVLRAPLALELVLTLFAHDRFNALFGDVSARERLLARAQDCWSHACAPGYLSISKGSRRRRHPP